ncbi:MAG: response regulator [Nitrospinaceae bacterium]|nr:response regulator [Nitrospinaceae bacterium]NIR55098.1 response regulator [Nitrospinaceae bacterium]NIS85507.1 response regulator [Nitrospinaceae bacterium]NIT82347.1 response regulator [Nitrospinaceae bacterium]NIU44563.1 response regulator [Nitrospinaceae bacterium]
MFKILLVEDNEMNRDMLCRRLQRKGFEVLTAQDGREGLSAAQTEAPDLILLDMSLPGLDGWEMARTLKATSATQAIPILGLSAHAMVSDRTRALEAGCDDYDIKPVDFLRLLEKMQTLLEKHPHV